jgi:hypothetical protein
MTPVLARLRRRLSFANVASALALFIALGGTSYAAISLPADSVGTTEIRTGGVGKSEIQTGGVGQAEIRGGAVGKGEIKTGGVGAAELHTDSVRGKEIKAGSVGTAEIAKSAVTNDQVKDGSVGMTKLDDATRAEISAGPARADVTGAGGVAGGNAKRIDHAADSGVYTVDFGVDVSKCTAVASLSNVDAADAGTATTAPGSAATQVTVHTFKPATGTTPPAAADLPFHVVVAC